MTRTGLALVRSETSFEVAERLVRALKVEYHELFLPDRLALGQMEQTLKLLETDLDVIDRRTF